MSEKKKKKDLLDEKYLGDLHHDLKNQIASIKAFNQLILRSEDNEEIDGYAKKIDQQADKLLILVSSFLDQLRQF